MLKRWCIKYWKEEGWLKKRNIHFFEDYAHKYSSILKLFREKVPDGHLLEVFEVYKKRGE